MINTLQEDRVRWYQIVTRLLDLRDIARTSWDYFGGFGIFKADGGGLFESDLNVEVVTAMGFTAPPQVPAEKLVEDFTIFDNYPTSRLVRVFSWNCDFSLYSQNGQKYAIGWSNANQYGTFGFYLLRPIDWEYLLAQNYAITFTAKADKNADMDVRFVNREDSTTTPWRIRSKVTIAADGNWHTVRIPLNSMWEHGAWVNATQEWLSPQGKFSWADVDSLQFVAEDKDLQGITVLFDTIRIEK
jgi:endoglucanase